MNDQEFYYMDEKTLTDLCIIHHTQEKEVYVGMMKFPEQPNYLFLNKEQVLELRDLLTTIAEDMP
jgi:hypothetical protein